MSLRIWLPLTGNLNNNGLEDTTVSSTNTTIDSNGKIGSCYSFNGSSSYLLGTQNFLSNNTEDWTFCCWMKVNNSHNGCLFSCRNSINNNGIAVFYYNSQWIIDDGVRWQFTPTVTINANIWYHVCVVRKKGVGKYLYINGILDSSTTTTGTPTNVCTTNFAVGNSQQTPTAVSANWFNGYLNDVRFYDNALSIKEIKELAKGLVAHYPLTGNVGTYNLVKGSNTDSVNTNKLMLSQQYGGSSKTIEYDGGVPCVKITRNTTEQSGWNVLYYQYLESTNIKVDTIYTISFDIIGSDNGNISLYGLRFANGTNELCKSVSIINNTFTSTEWSHIVFNTTTKTSFDGLTISDQVVYMVCPLLVNTEAWIMVKNFKVEEGTVDTSWNPNPADPSYSIYNGDNGQVIDISGYNNHGTIVGVLSADNNSIRNISSTKFNGTDNCIIIPYNSMCPSNIFTVNLWFYKDSLGSKNYETLFGGPNGFEMDTRANASTTLSLYMASIRGGSVFSPLPFNEWVMITMTRDGTNESYYVNGELKKTIEALSMPTGTYYIGAWRTESQQNYYGLISDFRLYNTILSDDDIKELYNTPIIITDKHDLITQGEFIEGGEHIQFNKNGVVNASGQVKPNLVSGTNRGEISSTAKSVSDGMLCYNSGGNGVCSVSEDNTVPVGNYSYDITGNTSGNRDFQQRQIPYIAGKSYTGSWWAKGSGTCLYRVWDVTANTQLLQKTFTLTNEWTFYRHTFIATQQMEDDNCTFHLGVTGNSEIHLCGMKLEENDHSTPWTYNKYDAGFDIDNNFVEENNATIGNLNYITAKELKEI